MFKRLAYAFVSVTTWLFNFEIEMKEYDFNVLHVLIKNIFIHDFCEQILLDYTDNNDGHE